MFLGYTCRITKGSASSLFMLEERWDLFRELRRFSTPGLASGDYHGQMDGSNFEKLYNKKLLPNLPSNSIIVMDNASYHSVQTDRAPTTATRKADIQVRSSSNHAMVYYLFSFSILVKKSTLANSVDP